MLVAVASLGIDGCAGARGDIRYVQGGHKDKPWRRAEAVILMGVRRHTVHVNERSVPYSGKHPSRQVCHFLCHFSCPSPLARPLLIWCNTNLTLPARQAYGLSTPIFSSPPCCVGNPCPAHAIHMVLLRAASRPNEHRPPTEMVPEVFACTGLVAPPVYAV